LQLAVEGRGGLLGPGAAEAGDPAVDEARVDRGERLVAEPEAVHHPAPEVLPHHVGAGHQALDDLDRLPAAQVEGDRALVAVHGEERGGHLPLGPRAVGGRDARLVALVGLDLDDVGAQEGQLVGAVGAGEVAGEVEDADAGERLGHTASRLALATAFTTSNSLRRSSMSSEESMPTSRYRCFQPPAGQRSGEATVVRPAGAPSSRRRASSRVCACESRSKGRPAELPRGKSLHTKRGTPQCSTMSLAQPMITVGMPLASRCRAARPTVWWQTGQLGTRTAASAPSSRQRRSSSGASVSMVTRWLRLVGAPCTCRVSPPIRPAPTASCNRVSGK